jgi:hypothetical protein
MTYNMLGTKKNGFTHTCSLSRGFWNFYPYFVLIANVISNIIYSQMI